MKNRLPVPSAFATSHVATKSIDSLLELLDSSLDVICSIDEQGRFITVSAAAKTLWGYEPEELEGTHYIDLVVAEDQELTEVAAHRIMSGQDVTNFENRYQRRDGTTVPMVWSARWNAQRKVMYCVARDGSEKQRVEKRLHLANRKAKLEAEKNAEILESMQDGFFAMDRKWRVTYFNQMAECHTGKRREEMLGKVFWDVFPTAVGSLAYREYHRAIAQNVQVNFELYSKLYNAWYEITACPSKDGLSVYSKDITARKAQEEALRLSNQRHELLSKATADALWDWDLLTDQCFFSDAFTTLFGYTVTKDEIYRLWVENIHEEDRQRVFASVQEALLDPQLNHWRGEYRFWRQDQTLAFVLDRGFIIRNDEGKAVRMVGSLQDVSRLKRKAEEVKKLSLVAQETVNAVVITDKEERITWVNKAFTEITEYSFEEAMGRKPSEFLQGKNTSPKMRAYLRERIKKGLPFQCDIVNYSKSGREYWIEIKGQPIFNERGEVEQFFAIETDITERIELQKMVVEEKIEAQREITKAIIQAQEQERSEIGKELHDNVNQLIATIKLYIENIRCFPEHRDLFIDKGIELAKKAMNESRSLSHRLVTPALTDASFKAAIDELLSHYQLVGTFAVKLRFTVCEEKLDTSFRVAIYRIVQECLTNVVKYAQASEVEVGILYEDGLVKVIVKDNGLGFQAAGKSCGIGLTNMKNRASLFKGTLQIDSEKGVGCAVTVHFPTINDQIIDA